MHSLTQKSFPPGKLTLCTMEANQVSSRVPSITFQIWNDAVKRSPRKSLLSPPGLLLYFSDGILPLIKSFYAVFFDPSAGMSDRDRRLRISSDILTALLVSCYFHGSSYVL